jgi:hypothetical protein
MGGTGFQDTSHLTGGSGDPKGNDTITKGGNILNVLFQKIILHQVKRGLI